MLAGRNRSVPSDQESLTVKIGRSWSVANTPGSLLRVRSERNMILVYLVSAIVVGPTIFWLFRAGSRRRRALMALAVIALVWCSETLLVLLVGDKPPAESTIIPRERLKP